MAKPGGPIRINRAGGPPVMGLAVGDACPGCGVRCMNLDVEHLDDCRYIGKIELLYCTLGCTGPHHRPECALGGRVRYTR